MVALRRDDELDRTKAVLRKIGRDAVEADVLADPRDHGERLATSALATSAAPVAPPLTLNPRRHPATRTTLRPKTSDTITAIVPKYPDVNQHQGRCADEREAHEGR